MVLQPLAQRVAHGKQDVFRNLTRIAEDKFIPQQQLAEFKKSIKLHHNAGSLPVGARDRGASIADLMRLQMEKYGCCQVAVLRPFQQEFTHL